MYIDFSESCPVNPVTMENGEKVLFFLEKLHHTPSVQGLFLTRCPREILFIFIVRFGSGTQCSSITK